MKLDAKLHIKGVQEPIAFTDTKKMRTGFVYHDGTKYELLFNESAEIIGSFHIKQGDLILIYGKDYLLNPDIPLVFYSNQDGTAYSERKSFLEKFLKH